MSLSSGTLAGMGAVGLAVSLVVLLPGGATPSRAQADVFLAPRGSDATRCTRAHPCHSLQRGFAVARPGQTVELAGGSYPEQEIEPRAKPGRRRIIFRAAAGERVVMGRLEIRSGVSDMEFRRLHFAEGWTLGPSDDGAPARNIVFRGTTGERLTIQNGRRIRVIGGSYGPSVDTPSQIKTYNPDSVAMPVDIVVDRVRFHDYTRTDDSVHTECLQVYAGLRVAIRNTRFTNCDGTGALALTTLSDTTLRRVVVENNWFDQTGDAFYAVQADGTVQGLVFRYNSATKGMVFTGCDEGRCGPARVVANYMPFNGELCQDGVSYSHNVLEGGRCGPTDVGVRKLAFVDARGFDLHLVPSSAARCRGDSNDTPPRDIDGQRRLRRFRPDAGADQLTGTREGGRVQGRCRALRG